MTSTQRLEITDESQVGDARRQVTDCARQLGHDEAFCGAVAIVASEAARNLARHGGGGELLWRKLLDNELPALEILALDQGPGMVNVAECLRDGHSTGGTAGEGLGAIRRISTQLDVYSMPGKGTALWARLDAGRPAAAPGPEFQTGGVSVALAGEELCGDGWEVSADANTLRVMVVDGLGHGPFAEEAAREALAVFRLHAARGAAEVLERSHLALQKTRGAAGSIVEILPGRNQVVGAGVGNVSMRMQGRAGTKSLVSDNGTLGSNMRRAQPHTYPWEAGSLLIMHTDGVGTNWNLNDYPGLSRRHPSLVAAVLYRDFRRRRDDATVVVASHRPPVAA